VKRKKAKAYEYVSTEDLILIVEYCHEVGGAVRRGTGARGNQLKIRRESVGK
jgi:hypothetical protein